MPPKSERPKREVRLAAPFRPREISISEARANMAEIMEWVKERDVVLTWWGRPVGVIVHPRRLEHRHQAGELSPPPKRRRRA